MREATASDVTRMRDSIGSFYSELGRFLSAEGYRIGPGSQAAGELVARPELEEDLHTAYNQATILIESAGDHLMAFVRLLDEPVQTLAPWTCVRAVLEASAVAAWLLDPGIDADVRVGRGFGRRLKGLEEQAKLGRVLSPEMAAHAEGRLALARQKAIDLGIRVETMPGVTELIRSVLDEEWSYRALSAIAHGHHWALHEFGFEVEAGQPAGRLLYRARKNMKPSYALLFGTRAVLYFGRPIWYWARLSGGDLGLLTGLMDGVFERFGAFAKDPFWGPDRGR